MRTPAGKECRYFYGDYFRGRHDEECRLLKDASPPLPWKPELCSSCPVPEILLANACQYLVLKPQLKRTLALIKKRVSIDTYCEKTNRSGFDPHIGCGECHELPPVFQQADNPPGGSE